MRHAALWLMVLFPITAFGLVYQAIHSRTPAENYWNVVGGITQALIVAAIPGAIGILLFRLQGDQANGVPAKSHFQ